MFTLYADWRLDDDEAETQRMLEAHTRYEEYLQANRHAFPTAAFTYASAEWRNNYNDHRAPHDSWVSEVRFLDRSLPESGGKRINSLELVLLGAYHDGHLHLRYRGVTEFHLASDSTSDGPIEVYRDEVRLSDNGRVVHEIEFLGSSNWLIECHDIEWIWIPLGATIEHHS